MADPKVHHHEVHNQPAPGPSHLAIDPVCGMTVDPHTSTLKAGHGGRTYYFCAAGCRAKFIANPAKYLGPGEMEQAVPEGAIYTCPMHPEIEQVGPGACPICGMALEPKFAGSRDRSQPQNSST